METDFKGLIDIVDNKKATFQWNMYKVPVDNNILNWTNYNFTSPTSPTLLKATINLSQVGDTYLDAA
jgi:hypothetical protein